MLVLSRRIGERIQIGDDITVEVLQIDQGRVRLSFDAPRSVKIYRAELLLHGKLKTDGIATRWGVVEKDGPAPKEGT